MYDLDLTGIRFFDNLFCNYKLFIDLLIYHYEPMPMSQKQKKPQKG